MTHDAMVDLVSAGRMDINAANQAWQAYRRDVEDVPDTSMADRNRGPWPACSVFKALLFAVENPDARAIGGHR